MSDRERSNEELIEAWRAGDEAAWDELWRVNEGLRYKAVKDWFGSTHMDDAMSYVSVEFWRAARNFDRSKGRFCTVFLTFVRNKSRSVWQRSRAARRGGGAASMSLDIHGKSCDTMPEVARHEELAIDREVTADMVADAEKRLERLTNRERSIVRMRADGLTLEEVSEVLGVSRERVRQIEARSLERLRMTDEEWEGLAAVRAKYGRNRK